MEAVHGWACGGWSWLFSRRVTFRELHAASLASGDNFFRVERSIVSGLATVRTHLDPPLQAHSAFAAIVVIAASIERLLHFW